MSFDAIATSAFGRRPVTRAQIEAQLAVKKARLAAAQAKGSGEAVHKWTLLRTLSEIRDGLGVSDRSLGVLSALLSFHPETALTLAPDPGDEGDEQGAPFPDALAGLVVFPSNKSLALRANGMSEPTLRRHLAALVEAGLILRRDSPNGKRFARRAPEGEGVAQAYGFDLAPLVARAGEFAARLDELRAERLRARLLKERVNLLRRDLSKRLAFALDEALPGPWDALRRAFLGLCTPLRKLRGLGDVERLAGDLERLQDEASAALEAAFEARGTTDPARENTNPFGDAAHFKRHLSESKPDPITDFEPASKEEGGETPPDPDALQPATREIPLGLVLEACPDVRDYDFSGTGLLDWRGFHDVAASVRPMLGISPDAWREAIAAMGEKNAGVAVAFILQRCEHSSEAERGIGADGRARVTVNGSPAIRSPGGYLRALTQKSREEPLSLWSAVLAHLAQRAKARRPERAL